MVARHGQPGRIAIGGIEIHPEQRLGQDVSHQFDHRRDGRSLAIFVAGAGKAVGRNQHQLVDAGGKRGRECPGDPASHRMADQGGFGNTKLIHERSQDQHAAGC